MSKQKSIFHRSMILTGLALLLISGWEVSIRLETMYKPLRMFFAMAFGEGISFSAAMTYFDWSIFEPPLWLLGCVLAGLLTLFVSSRRGGNFLLLPICAGLAAYGLTRDGSFLTGFWRLIQPALLLVLSALSLLNVTFRLPRRQKRGLSDSADALRMTDAPRLRRGSPFGEKPKRSA